MLEMLETGGRANQPKRPQGYSLRRHQRFNYKETNFIYYLIELIKKKRESHGTTKSKSNRP